MLHQITWPQYLLFVGVGLLIYYSVLWLVYYRKSDEDATRKQTPEATEKANQLAETGEDDLLGQPADEYGVSTLDSNELNFGPAPDEEFFENDPLNEMEHLPGLTEETVATTGVTENDELVQGDIADLLEDLKPVFELIGEQDPENRDRLIGLVVKTLGSYPRVLQSDLLEPVLQEIRDNALSELGMEISLSELKAAII